MSDAESEGEEFTMTLNYAFLSEILTSAAQAKGDLALNETVHVVSAQVDDSQQLMQLESIIHTETLQ